jgi:hypothetical protein
MYGIAAGIGTACLLLYSATGLLGDGVLPGWIWPLSWLTLTLVGAALCGFLRPVRAWRWGAVVVAVQPVCFLVVGAATGEVLHPSRSAAGMLALVIFTVLSAFVCPLAILASYAAARVRARQPRASHPMSNLSR